MDTATIFFIAVGLAMDAFAVSVASGISIRRTRLSHALKFGLFFGVFQFIMPVFGWYLGSYFAGYIEAIDHWVAFGLLSAIGVKMLFESREEKAEESRDEAKLLSLPNMTMLAVATSIDAMAAGISFSMVMNIRIWAAALMIGAVTFTLSACGVLLGKQLGGLFGKRVEVLGGIILIAMGCRVLLEHLFF